MDSFGMPTWAADQLQQHGQRSLADDPPLSVELTDIISLSGLLESPNSLVAPSRDHAKASSATSKNKEITGIESTTETHTRDHAVVQDHKHRPSEASTLTLTAKHIGKRRNRKSHVHKSSEKRRRDKIEARMKVLRQLVPNSLQLDKASLLDSTITHMKTLKRQIQVIQQMRQVRCPSMPPPASGMLQCLESETVRKPIPLVPVPMPNTVGWTTGTNYASSAPGSNFFLPCFLPFLPGDGGVSAPMPFLPPNSYSDQSMAVFTLVQATRADHTSATDNSLSSFMGNTIQSVAAEDNLFPSFPQNYPNFN